MGWGVTHWWLQHKDRHRKEEVYKEMEHQAKDSLKRDGYLLDTLRTRERAWYVIDPRESRVSYVTDIVTALGLLFTLIVTPFEVSFLPPPSSIDALFVLNRFVDLIFIVDMLLQFVLMYPTSLSNPDGSRWEDNPSTIICNYLSGWFSIDVLSIATSGFDIYTLANQPSAAVSGDATSAASTSDDEETRALLSRLKILRTIRVLRLVKVLRLLKTSRMLKRWETKVSINYGIVAIGRVGFFTICLAHWSAALWTLQGILMQGDREGWLDTFGYCVEAADVVPNRTYVPSPSGLPGWVCLEPVNVYAAALYFATATITSIGYGDLTATHANAYEQLFATVLMFANSVTWGGVIATFCEVMATMNPAVTDFRITMDNLNRYMRASALPAKLRQRLRDYFHRTQHLQRTASYRSVLLRMSPTLQGELLWYTNESWLARIPWLSASADPGFIVQLVLTLKPMVFAPSEVCTSSMLYIVHRGMAIYGGHILRSSSVWGEDCLLSSDRLRLRFLARAMTYLEVYMISRSELLTAAAPFAGTYRRLRLFTIKVALRRGLLLVTQGLRQRADGAQTKAGVIGLDGAVTRLSIEGRSPGATTFAALELEQAHKGACAVASGTTSSTDATSSSDSSSGGPTPDTQTQPPPRSAVGAFFGALTGGGGGGGDGGSDGGESKPTTADACAVASLAPPAVRGGGGAAAPQRCPAPNGIAHAGTACGSASGPAEKSPAARGGAARPKGTAVTFAGRDAGLDHTKVGRVDRAGAAASRVEAADEMLEADDGGQMAARRHRQLLDAIEGDDANLDLSYLTQYARQRSGGSAAEGIPSGRAPVAPLTSAGGTAGANVGGLASTAEAANVVYQEAWRGGGDGERRIAELVRLEVASAQARQEKLLEALGAQVAALTKAMGGTPPPAAETASPTVAERPAFAPAWPWMSKRPALEA